MIFYKAIKYIIFDTCIGILFENISNKFIRDSKYTPMKELPKVNDKFSILLNYKTGRKYYGAIVYATQELEPEISLAYAELYFDMLEFNGKTFKPTLMGTFTTDIYENSLDEWFYIK